MKPGIFWETKFAEDCEGSNYYIIDSESKDTEMVFPVYTSPKTKMMGYNKKVTSNAAGSDSKILNVMARIVNSFLISGYYFYNRYSEIVYEGDNVNVFGVMTYNSHTDSWDMTKPLAFIKPSYLGDYLSSLRWN